MQRRLIELFEFHFKESVVEILPLKAHASPRIRFRLRSKSRSVIGVKNDDIPENRTFIYLTEHFRKHYLPVPEIYCIHPSADIYLEEDLGDVTLYDLLQSSRSESDPFPSHIEQYYQLAIEYLPQFQVIAGNTIDYTQTHRKNHFGSEFMLSDMRYFRDQFLRQKGHFFDEFALNRDFNKLADYLGAVPADYFMYRDFQSRNIMIKNEQLYFIDYQSGCKGALQYDLVSLLFQSQAKIPVEARLKLQNVYLEAIQKHVKIDDKEFLNYLNTFALLRIMQVLGTYGLRGLKEGKQYFIDSIEMALENLRWLYMSNELPIKLPELERAIKSISATKQEQGVSMKDDEKLILSLYSFSYKQATPTPFNPHGGGFVFDCRCLPNPGREEAYKSKSGLDKEVVDYLESRVEVEEFFVRIAAIIEQALQAYVGRKFSSLSVAFGCTGGQHRSVYFVERLAKHLANKYNIVVKTEHLNKDYWVGNSLTKDKV